MTVTRTPTAIPDLHTAGPYLFLNNNPNLYGECDYRDGYKRMLWEIDGSAQREIIYPDVRCGRISPNLKFFAYITGGFDDTGELLKEGMVLHVTNLWTGAIRDVANIIPSDYKEKQEQMTELFITEENAPREYVDVLVGLESIYDMRRLLTWSPNSRYLAFPAMIDGISTDVYLYDLDTGKIQRKENEYLDVNYIEWSLDSQWILFNNILPYSSFPRGHTSYWSIGVDSSNKRNLLPDGCGRFDWISDTEFIDRDCNYGCGGDPPIGTNLFQIDVRTTAKREIWKGSWYGYAFDKENGNIILNAEEGDRSQSVYSNGIYLGPIFGSKKRISDAPTRFYDFIYRKGTAHRFLGLFKGGYDDISIKIEGITSDGKFELLKQGKNEHVSISPDYHWLVIYGETGLTLFDGSDRLIFDWTNQSVIGVTWKTNSQGLFFMTSDDVYFIPANAPKAQRIFECYPVACDKDGSISFILGVQLSSLPYLRVQPPSIEKQTQGNSIWSKATFKDLTQPGINEYSVNIPAYSDWRWDFSWCAKDQTGLGKILAPLDIGFYIGGEKIGEDIFRMYDSANSGGFCRTWATLLSGWQPGDETDLEIRYMLREAVNDGTREYPAGEYGQIIHVSVQ
jgi:hypothetical protein